MVNLAPPPSDWTEVIARAAKRFMNARVCFYKNDAGDFNPIDGSGSDDKVELIWVGLARVQVLRSPQAFHTEYQASANRAFRFQVDKESGLPFLSQGVKARVLDAAVPGAEVSPGGGDRDLEKLAYVVNAAINSSHQAVKTIELTATMDEVFWGWSVNDAGEVIVGG